MKYLIAFLCLFFLPLGAHAAGSAADQADIARVENYMNALTTAKARFLQTGADGRREAGTFYLNRPGRVRFEYDEPIDDFIVADGLFIYFYDGELKQQTNAPIGQTLADFILRKNISLSGDVKVTEIARSQGLLNIEVTQTKDPAAGSITLSFTQEPFALKKWKIKDAQGQTTLVELSDITTGMKFPYSLFVYADPKTGKTYNR